MIRVMLADDHAVMRDGLRHILETAGGFEVVGEASDGAATLALAERRAADVLLLDLSMPGPTGIELIRLIRAQAPSLRMLVLTMHAETQYAARAFKAGATGYLTKDSATAELVEAVTKVASGGIYVSRSTAESLARTLRAPADMLPHERLSARELDVMRRIVAGQTVTRIASDLTLSAKTVSTYKTRILEKMELPHEAALVRYAVRHDLDLDLGVDDA
ncbi:response regulator transcription factor [Burkholderia sp. SR8]|uniref:response regulator n=1 Tax=Burkholderia sp. SR8 TaxID=3062277 RepID=UPI004064B9E9